MLLLSWTPNWCAVDVPKNNVHWSNTRSSKMLLNDSPKKFGKAHEQALQVKAQADSLVERIERIKVHAVAEADGISGSDLVGKDADGRETLRALLALEAKDDRETLTRMLVGSEPRTE